MKRKQDRELRRLTAAVLAGVGALTLLGSTPAWAATTNKTTEHEIAQDQAGSELQRQQQSQHTGQAVRADRITVPVTAVKIDSSESLPESMVRRLLPALRADKVNIHELSKEIQLVNDTGAAKLNATFASNHDGSFTLHVQNEARDNDRVNLSVANTGNDYTGDWRTTLSYINNNMTQRADSFGVAYVTSPDEHFDDVKQAAFSYRTLLPRAGGALTLSYSYSNVDNGNVSPAAYRGFLDYQAAGLGQNLGLRYQHYLAYTSREKDALTFGLDYRYSKTSSSIEMGGSTVDVPDQKYDMLLGSVGFEHNNRDRYHAFSYQAGVSTNMGGDENEYDTAAPGSKQHFTFYTAGLGYQLRAKSDWIVNARAHGQYTSDHMPILAQLGAGGMYTVRGFAGTIASADKGIIGNLEIYTPEVAPNLRLLAFLDYGNLTNNTNSLTTSKHYEDLASTGVGLRYTDAKHNLALAVDYAKVINDVSDYTLSSSAPHANHRRWNMMFTVGF